MILDQKNYVKKAEAVINELAKKKDRNGKPDMVTTSQIRNLLSLTSDIYNEVMICMNEELEENIQARIQYLKVRFLYESGRSGCENVKRFVEKAEILKAIDEVAGKKSQYILFNRYMEALIAYHKFLGGRD